ncbi:histidine kinase [Erwinia sp. CPCC 100877]|nr:histidine kinase [Erwinia sp. CPCC 100877]
MNQTVYSKKNLIPIILILLLSLTGLFFIFNPKEESLDPETVYQQEFIEEIADEAKQLYKKTHLFASITIAQAILESDWGRSALATEANNLFGIKGEYNEQTSIMPTDEYVDGQLITVDDSLKKYETIQQSMADHMDFLKGSSYNAVKTSKNYKEAALALQNGGYATDPDYAEKLIQLIEEFKLYRYD